jgi:TonB family protein
MITSMRACRVGILITLVAALCSRTVLANHEIAVSPRGPQAARISRVDLTAEKVTIEWDATGRVVAISSSAGVPAPATASESDAAAAEAIATAQLTSFLDQRVTASQLSSARLKAEGKLQEPTIVKRVPPVYPPIASSARVSGDVGVQIVLGADGRAKDAKIVKSIPLLDQAALDAVKQWEFTPLVLMGKPVATSMRVTVTFTLKEK